MGKNYWGGGHNLHPLIGIGLTDMPELGWANVLPAHPSPTPLLESLITSPIAQEKLLMGNVSA